MKNPAHPGEIIAHSIEETGLSITDAAPHLSVTRPTLSRLINAKTGVSPEMAVRVSKACGSTPEHWLRMQMAYDMAQMRDRAEQINVQRLERA